MFKVIALLIMILLALVSTASFFLLSEAINSGEEQIADGQRRLTEGQEKLEEGELKLIIGKQKLSQGKKDYNQAKGNLFLFYFDKLLNSGKGFSKAKQRIVKGDIKVTNGEDDIIIGKEELAEGELELFQGNELIMRIRVARFVCAFVAVCFAALSIIFGFLWKHSLFKTFKHTK